MKRVQFLTIWLSILACGFTPLANAATYTLTLSTNGPGIISPTNKAYPTGTIVTLRAVPAADAYFAGWTGDTTNVSANPLSVLMDSNKVLTAHFAPMPLYAVTTSIIGQGSVSRNPLGGSYRSNSVVTLTASPAAHWDFLNWSGDAQGTSNHVSLTVNAPKTVTANFVEPAWIMAGPTNTVAPALGGSASFNVAASGTPPLAYAWALNGTPLAGATNPVLLLTNVQLADLGSYTVMVTNRYGQAASQPVQLTASTSCTGTNPVNVATEAALRAAIAKGGTVTFCFNGTITLTNPIVITKNVTLDATDHYVVISGQKKTRLFSITPGVQFTAINLRLADGWQVGTNGQSARGGAIFNNGGVVRMQNCTLTNNQALGGSTYSRGGSGEGGAIFNRNDGSVILEDCFAINNQAVGGWIGYRSYGTTEPGMGGVLSSLGGTVLFRNCLFSSNVCVADFGATREAQGGACNLSNTTCTIENSIFLNNFCRGEESDEWAVRATTRAVGARGGALYLERGLAVLSNVQFRSNLALGGSSQLQGVAPGEGGGIYCAGELSLRNCGFQGNVASSGQKFYGASHGQGGGLFNTAHAIAEGCTWTENSARGGNYGLLPPFSYRYGGVAFGGAVCNRGLLELTNCTISLNEALGGGDAFGGGIFSHTNSTTLLHYVTLATNRAVMGKSQVSGQPELTAGGANLANSNGVVRLRGSILAGNDPVGNAYGPLTDLGYNICSDGSCAFASGASYNFTDPQLLPLADNGGITPTMALKPTSPAIGLAAEGAPATDQRGVARPAGQPADAGAFEDALANPELPTYPLNLTTDGPGSLMLTPTNQAYPAGVTVTLSAMPSSTAFFTGWTGDISSPTNPLYVVMDTNKTLTAHFAPLPIYSVLTDVSGQGTVSLDPPGGSYLSNTLVNLTATPAPHWVFLNWSGGVQGTSNCVSLALNTIQTVTANFVEPTWIITKPANTAAAVGGSAMFSVTASGSQPLTYAWIFNGTPLDATNSVLTLTNVQPYQAGNYSVVVSNPYGQATSEQAKLTVNTPCTGDNRVTVGTEAALRAAITKGGTVTFCYNGTITISSPIAITKDVTLNARDHYIKISGNRKTQLFSVSPGVRFTAINLTLADGWRVGAKGGYHQPGQTVRGGAIFNNGGFVRLLNCTLTNNLAQGGDGSYRSGPHANGGHGEGGAIYSRNGGSVALEDCLVANNRALGGRHPYVTSGSCGSAHGGALYSLGSTTTFRNTVFTSNSCESSFVLYDNRIQGHDAQGGACFLSNAVCSIQNSLFLGNSALGNEWNSAEPVTTRGGALYLYKGSTVLSNVLFSANRAWEGGGVYSAGPLWLRACQFTGNATIPGNPGAGGGLWNASRVVANGCTWRDNTAQGQLALGGAVWNRGTLILTNCTIALNRAQGDGPASSLGGGLFNHPNGTSSLHHVTLATNQAGLATGANLANSNGVVRLRATILAGDADSTNAYGRLIDLGYNLSSDGSCTFTNITSFNFTDPQLLPLADYGGLTPTMALQLTSPAIDLVPMKGAPAKDQRGVARPVGAAVDAGAFEGSFEITKLVMREETMTDIDLPKLAIFPQSGDAIQFTFPAEAHTQYLLQSSTNLVQWTTDETITTGASAGAISRSFHPADSRQRFFRLRSNEGGPLQAQTNGLGANWVDVPDSTATNRVVVPIEPAACFTD